MTNNKRASDQCGDASLVSCDLWSGAGRVQKKKIPFCLIEAQCLDRSQFRQDQSR